MPVISSFYGIDIKLYFRDHFPPHFHAFYGEFSAEIAIHDLRVLAGWLPSGRCLSFSSGRSCIAPSFWLIGRRLGTASTQIESIHCHERSKDRPYH